jgi:phosphoenolpyruvate---glycerone phosphotransferase subunit DhaL
MCLLEGVTVGFTSKILGESFDRVATGIELVCDQLNAIDAKIGDGDLGVTLTRCARGVRQVIPQLPEDIGMALMMCVQAITKASGASFATLLATALLSMAKSTKARKEVPWSEIPELLRVAEEAMMVRGKAAIGEKTVIDTVHAFRTSIQGLDDPQQILDTGSRAVREAIEHFRGQPNKAGRARIWSERSIGLDDPGMVAFEAMLEILRSRTDDRVNSSGRMNSI